MWIDSHFYVVIQRMNTSDIVTKQFDITLVLTLTALHLYPAAIQIVKLNLSISIPDERAVPCRYVHACNSIVNFASWLSHSLEKKADTPTTSYLSEQNAGAGSQQHDARAARGVWPGAWPGALGQDGHRERPGAPDAEACWPGHPVLWPGLQVKVRHTHSVTIGQCAPCIDPWGCGDVGQTYMRRYKSTVISGGGRPSAWWWSMTSQEWPMRDSRDWVSSSAISSDRSSSVLLRYSLTLS